MNTSQPTRLFLKLTAKIVLFSVLIGCLTPIDLRFENKGGMVVISGQISTFPDQNFVEVGITSDDARLPFPQNDADVVLHDEDGNTYQYHKDDERAGMYVLPELAGIPGKLYFIETTLPNSQVYRSVAERMPVTNGAISTHYEINTKDFIDFEGTLQTEPFIEIYANSTIHTPNFFRWYLEEAYMILMTASPGAMGSVPPPCIITQASEPQRIVLFNGSDVGEHSIQNQLMGKRIVDKAFYYKFYFTTYQHSITKESHEYWRKVNVLANQIGSIFDSPPGKIKGNIVNTSGEENTAGYFQAVNTIVDRIFINRISLPFALPAYCDFDPFRNPFVNPYPKECSNCSIVRNSSFKRPDWFE